MKTVYVVPHTEATHHVEDLVGGWYDTELTQRGHAQARATAAAISRVARGRPRIYASDLKRAVQTAQPIARAFDAELTVTPALREIGCGIAEGKPQAWLDERINYPPTDQSRLDHVIIEGAETRRAVAERVYGFVDRLMTDDATQAVVATHGVAATFVIAAWLGMPMDAAAFVSFDVSPGGITRLEFSGQWGDRQITTLDDTAHLAGL